MELCINTASQGLVVVCLKKRNKLLAEMKEKRNYGSQALLPLIEKLLKHQKLKFQDLERIAVNTAPGSFTGVRVGISVANALVFALKIPVNGKRIETNINY